jgi:hypothetical protein
MSSSRNDGERQYQPIIFRPPAPTVGDFAIPGPIRVAAPPNTARTGAARFVGAWIGFWGDALPHLLVVEDVKEDHLRTLSHRTHRESL